MNALLSKLTCTFRSHAFAAWSGKCVQERRCGRCGRVEKRESSHDWQAWILAPSECAVSRECALCDQREDRVLNHDWGEWQSSRTVSCLKERICRQCYAVESQVQHSWSETREKGTCLYVNACTRCGARGKSNVCHNWGRWEEHHSGEHKKVCERCGEMKTEKCSYFLVSRKTWQAAGGSPFQIETQECSVCGGGRCKEV